MRGSAKLRLIPLWPALAAVSVMGLAMVLLLPPLFEEIAEDHLAGTLRLLARAVEDDLAPGEEDADPRRLQERATRLAADAGLRITVIRGDGHVLADSDRTWPEVGRMDDHSRRPEVAAALDRGQGRSTRRSTTTGRRYVYAAQRLATAAGDPWVLRLAQPVDDLTLLRSRIVQAAGLALLATLATIALISVWLDRRFLGPLAELIDGTRSLAAGGHGHRLAPPDQPDLADLAKAVNRMMERLEEQVAAAEKERDHLHAILASMGEGVLVVDGEGRAVLANPAFRELFGTPEDPAGRPPLELTRQPELAAVVERTLAEGAARLEEVVLDDGPEARTVALAGSVLRSAPRRGGGRGPGAVVVARDTSETTRLSQMRRDFVANVSHELKTPLSAIRGFAETLRDGALEDESVARRFTGRILDQCRRLQEMLGDLLILSRLESVEIPLERKPVDLVRLAGKALETVAPYARERRITLVAALPEEGTVPAVTGDPGALERLLLNLLENAVKYNREGGEVRVAVALDSAATHAPPEVVLEVADTGIGIPAEALPRIFERFYRVDKGRARDEGGTGLGLAIVKHVAQAHGGRVEVTSEHRRGSTFRIHLPAGGGDGPGDL